jgi:uncharacterized protein YjiS (DUF1127 family)
MTRITTDSRADPEAHVDTGDRTRWPALLAGALDGASSIVAVCRNKVALAMMSERDLDDLGLLSWEVWPEIDGGAEGRAAARRAGTLVHCIRA